MALAKLTTASRRRQTAGSAGNFQFPDRIFTVHSSDMPVEEENDKENASDGGATQIPANMTDIHHRPLTAID